MAASKGSSCSSRNSRSPPCAGAWLSPPSDSACPTRCLPVARTRLQAVVTLDPADVRHPHHRRQVGILAVGLLDAAPAWISPDIEHGRKRVAGTGGEQPRTEGAGDLLDQPWIERGSGTDALLEAGRTPGKHAVDALLVDDRGDAQTRLLDEVALQAGWRSARPPRRGDWWSPRSRVISPIPSGTSSVSRSWRMPSSQTSENAHTDPSCASFSASVMRESRSATRASVGAAVSRYSASSTIRRSPQPFTAPETPLTMCRSATM